LPYDHGTIFAWAALAFQTLPNSHLSAKHSSRTRRGRGPSSESCCSEDHQITTVLNITQILARKRKIHRAVDGIEINKPAILLSAPLFHCDPQTGMWKWHRRNQGAAGPQRDTKLNSHHPLTKPTDCRHLQPRRHYV